MNKAAGRAEEAAVSFPHAKANYRMRNMMEGLVGGSAKRRLSWSQEGSGRIRAVA